MADAAPVTHADLNAVRCRCDMDKVFRALREIQETMVTREEFSREVTVIGPKGQFLMEVDRPTRVVLDKCGDDDPAIVLDWDIAAVNQLVAWFNAPGAARPPFLGAAPAAVTAASLQNDVLAHVARSITRSRIV